jgi:hypothetical protein
VRVALGLSVYAVPLDYGLSIETTGGATKVQGGNVTLPLPALALRGEFLLTPKLFLNASLDAMYFQYEGFKGSLLDVNMALEYRLWKHFGLGLNFNPLYLNASAEGSGSSYPGADWFGSVNIRYNALMLYGKLAF